MLYAASSEVNTGLTKLNIKPLPLPDSIAAVRRKDIDGSGKGGSAMWFCGTTTEICDRVGCSRPPPLSDYDSLEVVDPQSNQHMNLESDPEASCFWPVLFSERGGLDLNSAIPTDNVELWRSLQGMWYRQGDNICVGEICGAGIFAAFQVPFVSDLGSCRKC